MTPNPHPEPSPTHALGHGVGYCAAGIALAVVSIIGYALNLDVLAYPVMLAAAYVGGIGSERYTATRRAANAGGAYIIRLDPLARRWRVIPEDPNRPVSATRVARALTAELNRLHPIGHVSIDTHGPDDDPSPMRLGEPGRLPRQPRPPWPTQGGHPFTPPTRPADRLRFPSDPDHR